MPLFATRPRPSSRTFLRSEQDHPSHSHGTSYSSQASDERYDYVSSLLQQSPSPSSEPTDRFTSPSTSRSSSSSLYRDPSSSHPWTADPDPSPISYTCGSESDDDRFCTYDDLPPSPRQSFHPAPSSSSHPDKDDTMPLFQSIAALLASTSLSSSTPAEPSPDRCFCGQVADEDSIYCSVACGRKDAMQALCADEDRKKGSSRSSGGSHYRRVEQSESKKEKERLQEEKREREKVQANEAERKDRLGKWRINATKVSATLGSSSTSRMPAPTITPASPPLSARSGSRSTSHSTVPSLSSTTSSTDSYSTCDTEFSDHANTSAPPSPFPSTPTRSLFPREIHFGEPVSPQPTLRPGHSVEDMYNSYLGVAGGAGEEERDRVPSIGWGGEQLKERVKGKMAKGPGHQRGKLSFDDVVGIMSS